MSFKRCPGSLSFTQPKIELVRCPHCGAEAEVWSDEADGTCAMLRAHGLPDDHPILRS